MNDIDHEYTNEIVCPHCGHEYLDSWDISKNEDGAIGDMQCDACGGMFRWECLVSVTYSTGKIDADIAEVNV